MTIDETIKDLDIIRFNPHWDELVKEEYWQELMEMSMNALEEVQQYRAIGTPEECRAAMEKQPVFNMDKVVEQLNDKFRVVRNDEDLEWNRAMDEAITIVKGGGVDGN